MAKLFLASSYEISCIMDGDISAPSVRKDWYRQRFIAEVEGLLNGTINIEIPFTLPRDNFDASIIPGGITGVEESTTVRAIRDCLGVNVDDDYILSVMTGKRFRAHGKVLERFALIEPRRSRDVMLMASWSKDTPSPSNYAKGEICESPVVEFASFEDGSRDYCLATWVIRSDSPLGELLVEEAQQHYTERLQAGIEHFSGYVEKCATIRDSLYLRLSSMAGSVQEKRPAASITFSERYLHAVWYDDGELCDDYYFYTDIGVGSIIDLTNSWIANGVTFRVNKDS